MKETHVWEVGRTSDGSSLYMYGLSDWAVILDPAGNVTTVPLKPSSVAYLNDEGQWAAWVTPGEAHFLGGWMRPAKGLWADPGARHYLVQTKEGNLELGTTDGRLKQPVAGGFDPLRIFSHDGKVYVFGVWRDADETRCLVFRETGSGFGLETTIKIAPYGYPVSIVDMDLSAERVVLNRSLDLRPEWVVFDFRARTLKSIGETSDHGVFLREDLLARAKRIGLHRGSPSDLGNAG